MKETSNIKRSWILYKILPDFSDIYVIKSLVYLVANDC